jgi:phosphoribosylaminoimidazole-succinocarboxamide synthase
LKTKKVYEGRGKKVYETDNVNQIILEFKDETFNYDEKTKKSIKNRGVINAQVSSYLFRYLESYHVPSHFIEQISDKSILVRKLNMIPVEIVIHNIAAGSLVKRFNIDEGKELECPIIEYYLKDEEKQNTMINENHLVSFGHATAEEIKEIHRFSSKINAVLRDFFRRRNFNLVEFRVEFGRKDSKVILGDELSLDTLQIWDLEKEESNQFIQANLNSKYFDEIKNRMFMIKK